ncbi:MAG: hypothetical protein JSW73_04910 [Candidatus Woesearchaeota archaeon]|nr:MAG: hypothetical protein JSW73_04910 [Candidatus Woesearchaeota archaeon]
MMKKGTVQNFMWVIGVIILILAFVVIFWLMSKGLLTKGGFTLSDFLDQASNITLDLS